jgi:RNA polymerase sigma-70 factor (ECF subfamily)
MEMKDLHCIDGSSAREKKDDEIYELWSDDELSDAFGTKRGQKAFSELVNRYRAPLYRLAFSFFHDYDESHDAVQEIIILLEKKLPKYGKKSQFSTWLYRVAINRIYVILRDSYHKHKNERFRLEEVLQDPKLVKFLGKEGDQFSTFMEQENFRQLEEAINSLPQLSREIIYLKCQNQTAKQIAEQLGITETNVTTTYSRTISAIKGKIGKK